MKNEKTQAEWYALAKETADTIFAKQQELFGDLTDTVYYCVEVTRFDSFIKMEASVSPKNYQPENMEARKVAEYLNRVSEDLYLSEYTTKGDFEAYAPTVIRKMEGFAEAVKNIINN